MKVIDVSTEEISSGCLKPNLNHELGIYAWTLRPTISNVQNISPLLSMSAYTRRIEGCDIVSGVNLKVSVDKSGLNVPTSKTNSLDNLYDYPYCLDVFSRISTLLAPPFYIGMSDRLAGRMDEHRRDIERALNGSEVENGKNHFGWALKDYSEELLRYSVISKPLKISDISVRIYVFDSSKISIKQVQLIENALITIYSPRGNKKYMK